MILGLGERDTCFKMSKVRLVYRSEKKNDQGEYKKNAFSMNHFGQNFHFFHWLLFSRNFSKELKRRSLSIRKVANFHKFEHMWYQRKENRV